MTERIEALVFDVFGTVVDWRSGIVRALTPFLASHGVTCEPAAFADAWRALYSPAMEEVRSGRRQFVTLDVLHRENLVKLLDQIGVDASSFEATVLDKLNLAWHALDPWPDVVEGLSSMKERFIIAPLSNGNIRLMLDIAKRNALPWDAILGAEITQAYKPDPKAYLRTVDTLMLRPEQVCLVAAHNDDLSAAQECGFRTAFVPRTTEYGPHQTQDLSPTGEWDFVVNDFIDLSMKLHGG